jgi:multiple antibiotic resistance protein
VIVPYAIPFVAGPGAIALVITLASSTRNESGAFAALAAVGVVVVVLPIAHLVLAKYLKISETAMQIATRLGGLLIATIGIQLILNGIKTFFSI